MYDVRQLQAGEQASRLAAMNRLAAAARRDRSVAEPLVEALLREGRGVPADPRVERIAVWAVEKAETVRREIERRLAASDRETFLLLADWLEQAGQWTPERRSLEERARRERLRIESDDVQLQLAGLEALSELGPAVGELASDAAVLAAEAEDATVRRAAARAAAIGLAGGEAVELVLAPLVGDPDAGVRLEAILGLGIVCPNRLAAAVGDLEGGIFVEQEAWTAVWGLRHTAAVRRLSMTLASRGEGHGLAEVAAWGLGFVSEPTEEGTELLRAWVAVGNPLLAARAVVALGRRGEPLDEIKSLMTAATEADGPAQLGAVFALGRCTGEADRPRAVERLLEVLEGSLQAGDVGLSVAAVGAAARLGGGEVRTVLSDIVDQFEHVPVLQLTAAESLLAVEREAGIEALLQAAAADDDRVRELAAFRLGTLPVPPVERLRTLLQTGGEPVRGSAALSLALAGGCSDEELDLDPRLRRRLDAEDSEFEASWRVRASYVAARAICGGAGAWRDHAAYMVNANVSRVGLYVALLHTGDAGPMDALLSGASGVDASSFLRDGGFQRVVAYYFPDSPAAEMLWLEDEAAWKQQIDRLRDWWRWARFRVEFDEQSRVFRGPDSGC